MKFSVVSAVLALASAVVAVPSPNANVCGQAQLNCCNEQSIESENDFDQSPGLLNDLLQIGDLEDISLFEQCSALDIQVPVIGVGLQDLIKQKCNAEAACCQQSPSTANGLIAVSLPCIPLNIL